VPKGVPPVPKIPVKVPQVKPQKPAENNLTLEDEIKKGVKLKKVVTVEKTGIDYLKKKGSISANTQDKSTGQSEAPVKNDMFAEMRRVQLKKINK
jgi:hypothetical protein